MNPQVAKGLEDILLEFGEVIYPNDFEDSWEHIITFEKVVKSKAFQATYQEGNGERPPEDMGVAWGFRRIFENYGKRKAPGA